MAPGIVNGIDLFVNLLFRKLEKLPGRRSTLDSRATWLPREMGRQYGEPEPVRSMDAGSVTQPRGLASTAMDPRVMGGSPLLL